MKPLSDDCLFGRKESASAAPQHTPNVAREKAYKVANNSRLVSSSKKWSEGPGVFYVKRRGEYVKIEKMGANHMR